jgi:hypothetical protein
MLLSGNGGGLFGGCCNGNGNGKKAKGVQAKPE